MVPIYKYCKSNEQLFGFSQIQKQKNIHQPQLRQQAPLLLDLPRRLRRPSTHHLRVKLHLSSHTFCYVCIQQWALVKNACPLCKHSLGGRKLERDLIAACIIGDLEVRCFHEGCQWTGIESIRKKHQRCCLYKPKNYISNSHSLPVVEVSDLDQI